MLSFCFCSDRAVGAFLESKDLIEQLLQGKTLNLTFQGIDHFNNQVGFVDLTKDDHTAMLLKIAGKVFSYCKVLTKWLWYSFAVQPYWATHKQTLKAMSVLY